MPTIDQIFGFIAEQTGQGAEASGDLSEWLIGAGLSAAAIAHMLQTISANAQATPSQIAYAQQEIMYLQQRDDQNAWLKYLIGGALVFVAYKAVTSSES